MFPLNFNQPADSKAASSDTNVALVSTKEISKHRPIDELTKYNNRIEHKKKPGRWHGLREVESAESYCRGLSSSLPEYFRRSWYICFSRLIEYIRTTLPL